MANTMKAKIIPIIDSPMEAGDQAVRAEYEKLLADLFLSFSARITRLQIEINLKFADVLADLEEEEGGVHQPMTEAPDDIKIEMLRAALQQLLDVTMFKDHPIESQFAIDALNATKPDEEEGGTPELSG